MDGVGGVGVQVALLSLTACYSTHGGEQNAISGGRGHNLCAVTRKQSGVRVIAPCDSNDLCVCVVGV